MKKFSIKKFLSKQGGQILVESMVALTMVVIGLLGLLSLLTYSIGLNKVVSDDYVASYLAAEGVEVVKNMIDTNVANGEPYNYKLIDGNYELDYDSTVNSLKLYNSQDYLQFDGNNPGGPKRYTYNPKGSATPTPFTRQVSITTDNGNNELVVKSTVSWVTRGASHQSITVEDHFFNWRPN